MVLSSKQQSYKNKNLLYQLYVAEKKTCKEIARKLKCGHHTIWVWLKKYQIPLRDRSTARIGRKIKKQPIQERFRQKVAVGHKKECWEWQGNRDQYGYGVIFYNGKLAKAHRLSWTLHFGNITDGLCVCHHCDNPSCVNPSHLFLGTHQDNAKDRESKGRGWHPKKGDNNDR